MTSPHIGVVGATGAVGREVLRIMEQRDVPMASFRPIASERSRGKTVSFKGEDIPVTVIGEAAFNGLDLVLWDTPDEVALEWVPRVRDQVVSVDNSAAYRMHDDVPLVVPEVNADAARAHTGIVANPNCTMVTLLMPLAPLHRLATARRVICSSYQSTSGAGVAGVEDLYEQLEKLMNERDAVRDGTVTLPAGRAFSQPIAFNVIPQVGGLDDLGRSSEERRVAMEPAKILGARIDIFATAVRVPTVAGHGVSAWVEFDGPITVDQARAALEAADGVEIADDPAGHFATPLAASGKDKALVARLRADPENTNALGFFSACDNLRKGAALNAVQIAELLIARSLL